MTTKRKKSQVDWGVWVRSFGVWLLGFVGLLVTFYFTTKESLNEASRTLTRHESQFADIGKQFEKFNGTMQHNYEDWAKINKADQDKAEKMRENFLTQFTQFSVSTAGLKVQVDNVAKQLDSVTNKLDSIQRAQQK